MRRLLDLDTWTALPFFSGKRARKRARLVYRYTAGEGHLYLGTRYPLRFLEAGETLPAAFDGKEIVLRANRRDREYVRDRLRAWYRARAAEHFAERLALFCGRAPWTGGHVAPLRLRRMKRTLGSCSRDGRITLNPHLVKAPPFLVDSVVAHEVCHLAEHNHGRGFYALFDQLYPEWPAARAQLRAEWPLYLAE